MQARGGETGTDLIRVESAHSVAETLDRLSAMVEKAGATVFARIDHAKGAQSIGASIPPNQVLIFGNPKLGTDVIAASPTAGLDLPMRVQAYEADGKTWIVYRDTQALAKAHDVPGDHPKIEAIAGALAKLTQAAAAP